MIALSKYGFRILQIETYGLCNMSCGFCPYPLKNEEKKKQKIDLEKIYQILDQIDSNDPGFKYVTFSQFNEPLLDNRIFEIIKYSQQKKLNTFLITNGLLLNKKKKIKNIQELKPELKISLQVIDSSKHKFSRGINMEIDDYLKTIIEFIKIIKNTKIKLTIDIGSNFNDNKVKVFLKNIFGLSVGDKSVPETLNETFQQFIELLNTHKIDLLDNNDQSIKDLKKKYFESYSYLSQDGWKLFENVKIKIKKFHFGRAISENFPRDDNFICSSEILGIQSDGNIVPCCLAYDDTISLGNIYKKSIFEVLKDNSFLKNLRDLNGNKSITCKKCFGEPTQRGVFFRNFYSKIPEKIRIKVAKFLYNNF